MHKNNILSFKCNGHQGQLLKGQCNSYNIYLNLKESMKTYLHVSPNQDYTIKHLEYEAANNFNRDTLNAPLIIYLLLLLFFLFLFCLLNECNKIAEF